jgi:ribulose 1,5-bisphosphate synthetase/thiazole synthase
MTDGAPAARAPDQLDVLVCGATAGGVMAAIAAAEEGAHAILVSANAHVGGMVSGGLGKTDIERQERIIGGLAARFFAAVGDHYGEATAYRFEPSVAERTLRSMLAAAGVHVVLDAPLTGVAATDGRIEASRWTGTIRWRPACWWTPRTRAT